MRQQDDVCRTHRAYRTEHEAQQAARWHPGAFCSRCQSGMVWHVWRCDLGPHHHVGHATLRALAGNGA